MLAVAIVVIVITILYLDEGGEVIETAPSEKPTPAVVPEVNTQADELRISSKRSVHPYYTELVGNEGYINTDTISIGEIVGKKVILLDFWTYSCINCQRTLPYLTSWYDKYKDEGLEIIGIHTPEFDFEKEYDNVVRAVEKYGIEYPVVQDNDRETWRAYKNRYWPRKYIIDIDGFIVYDHIGEGAYAQTEKKIQELLAERADVLDMKAEIASDVVDIDASAGNVFNTKELYFGYGFDRDQLGNSEGLKVEQIVDYSVPDDRKRNLFYLDGSWFNDYDFMEVVSDTGVVYLDYYARDVHIVAGSDLEVEITILLDGQEHKKILVKDSDLYTLVSLDSHGQHSLEIHAPTGFQIFTFTFG
jgi:thiol-disulfide isomerase/thioredoxin